MADTVDLGSLPPPGHERHYSDSSVQQDEMEQTDEELSPEPIERSVYL
jgi:hypothetical protein